MKKRSIYNIMRVLHRDIGYFVIGLTMIYVISGVVLIYRDTDVFTYIASIEKQLEPNLSQGEVGSELRLRRFRFTEIDGDIHYFVGGNYNSTTGVAAYKVEKYPFVIEKMVELHIAPSDNKIHWLTTTYSILLGYLALSSFWLFRPKTKRFKRGAVLSILGFLFAFVLIVCL